MKYIKIILSFSICLLMLITSFPVFADPVENGNPDEQGTVITEEGATGESSEPIPEPDPTPTPTPTPAPTPTPTPTPEPAQEEKVEYPVYVIPEKQPYKETLRYWLNEQKNSIVLTGDPTIDIIIIADSQVGYVSSNSRYMIPEEGARRKPYTRYGAFMDRPYCDWCDAFVSFCVYYAGLTDYPLEISCLRHELALKKSGYFREWGQYIPNPGDIVFLSLMPESHNVTHVGIVEYIEEKSGEAPVLHTIEGNVSVDGVNVARCVRSFDDVIGYGTYKKGIPNESPKNTWRDDDAKSIPINENNTYFCYPAPYKTIVSYIKGSGLDLYNRLYNQQKAAIDESGTPVLGAQKQPETASEIEVAEIKKVEPAPAYQLIKDHANRQNLFDGGVN